jgi:hypothetical protein
MRHMPLRDTGIRNGKFPSSMPCQLALPPWGSRTFEIDTEISICAGSAGNGKKALSVSE